MVNTGLGKGTQPEMTERAGNGSQEEAPGGSGKEAWVEAVMRRLFRKAESGTFLGTDSARLGRASRSVGGSGTAWETPPAEVYQRSWQVELERDFAPVAAAWR